MAKISVGGHSAAWRAGRFLAGRRSMTSLRNLPVYERLFSMMSSGVPTPTTSPPPSPP
jgi:hypothetical protein